VTRREPAITRAPDAGPDGLFYLDLHTHTSDGSNDAHATVEAYLRWIQRRREAGYRIDGFVLTEHRNLDPRLDYSALAERYDAVVLRGMEVETDTGHVLVYGVSDRFYREIDVLSVTLPYEDVFRAAREHGGIAVGAHAGRRRIGLAHHVDLAGIALDSVELIEALNGGSSEQENARALLLGEQFNLGMIGGSDSHFVSTLGSYLTAFREPVRHMEALVEQLRAGLVHAVTADGARSVPVD